MPSLAQNDFEQHLRQLAIQALREQDFAEQEIPTRIEKMMNRMKITPVDREPWKDLFNNDVIAYLWKSKGSQGKWPVLNLKKAAWLY